MIRILFFETTEYTGATRVTRTIEKKLRERFETRIAVIKDSENPKEEIQNAIYHKQPDVLFSSFSSLNPDVIIIGKERKKTVVVRQDYNLKDVSDDNRIRIIQTYPQADWIIAQTPEMKEDLLYRFVIQESRIKVIENPLDEEDILLKASEPNPFRNNGCFHFLWVGRKDPSKDLPTLNKAFELVHKHCPNTDLTLVSNDNNPYRWIKNADCLVISSISEASPNVLREALFLETAVVSTDCSPSVRRLLPPERIAKVSNVESLSRVMLSIVKRIKN